MKKKHAIPPALKSVNSRLYYEVYTFENKSFANLRCNKRLIACDLTVPDAEEIVRCFNSSKEREKR